LMAGESKVGQRSGVSLQAPPIRSRFAPTRQLSSLIAEALNSPHRDPLKGSAGIRQ